jgi:GT2 family glycosyltransferase
MAKTKVYCGFPTVGTVVDSQNYMLRELQKRYADDIEFVFPEKLVQRIFHDFARNGVVEEFLASDCDILWMLDSDVVPQRHVLDLVTLHQDKWEVAGAPYPIFIAQPGEDNRQILFTAYAGSNGVGLAPVGRIPYEGTDFVDGLATGCVFLKRSVFAKLDRPYFEHKYSPDDRRLIEGEDLGFCLKLQKLGIKFFTDYSMVCKHVKSLCLLEMNNYAIEYANKAVLSYDRDIKNKVEAAVRAAFQAGKDAGRKESQRTPETGARVSKGGLILP